MPPETWVAASEALLFQSDRRGCRMEWTDDAAARAAGEWGGRPRSKARSISSNTTVVAAPAISPTWAAVSRLSPRKGLHDAVRRRYKVIVDSPEVLIADLSDSGTHWNAN